MIHAQNAKYVLVTSPVAIVNNASWTTAEIDTAGWDYAEVAFCMGANDIDVTALKVTESDTSGSGHVDVPGLVYGTSANIAGSTSALPLATDDDSIFKFEIDLKNRKRYLDFVATNGNGAAGGFACIVARLSRAENAPTTAAEAGCADILRA